MKPEFENEILDAFKAQLETEFGDPPRNRGTANSLFKSLRYAGAAIYDSELHDFHFKEAFLRDDPVKKKKRKQSFTRLLQKLQSRNLPYLTKVLLERYAATGHDGAVVLRRSGRNGQVLTESKGSQTVDEFCKSLELDDFETKTVQLHEQFLKVQGSDCFLAFVPISYSRNERWEILTYLTVFGLSKGVDASSPLIKCVSERLESVGFRLLKARLNTIIKKERLHAHSAAGATVFARNMSHNIGSHVLPRAGIHDLAQRAKQLRQPLGLFGDALLETVAKLKDQLDDYIRQKADFLAEMTTEPVSSATSEFLFRDIVLPFASNTVLIDCLAANEGVRYRNWNDSGLRFRFVRYVNGKAMEVFARPDGAIGTGDTIVPYAWTYGEDNRLQIVGESQDVAIAVPGALGRFALYGIFENLIRNAAKHNRATLDSLGKYDLTITLHINDDLEDPEYYIVQIHDDLTNPTGVYPKIADLIIKDIVDAETGRVRTAAWGLAEMVISANLLTGSSSMVNRSFRKRDRVFQVHNSLQGEAREVFGNRPRLVYEFRLAKAKQAVFIGPGFHKSLLRSSGAQSKWRERGIAVVPSLEQFRSLTQAEGVLASFQFAVIEDKVLPKAASPTSRGSRSRPADWRQQLPFRIIRINAAARADGVSSSDVFRDLVVRELVRKDERWTPDKSDQLLHRLWGMWCRRWLGGSRQSPDALRYDVGLASIHLGQLEGRQLSAWKKVTEEWNLAAGAARKGKEAQVWLKVGSEQTGVGKGIIARALRQVVFDRHGGAIAGRPPRLGQDSYIAFDKSNEDFSHIFQPRFPLDNVARRWTFPFELFEAGMLQVLVLDERIAERAVRPLDTRDETVAKAFQFLVGGPRTIPCMWHVARAAGVWIATHLLIPDTGNPDGGDDELKGALHRRSYAAARSSLKERDVKSPFRSTCPTLKVALRPAVSARFNPLTPFGSWANADHLNASQIDIIVAHQGVLDMIQEPLGGYTAATDRLRTFCSWLIVESGRGVPPQVQDSAEKFLPFSAVDRCFGDSRLAKLLLSKRLMESARRGGAI